MRKLVASVKEILKLHCVGLTFKNSVLCFIVPEAEKRKSKSVNKLGVVTGKEAKNQIRGLWGRPCRVGKLVRLVENGRAFLKCQ